MTSHQALSRREFLKAAGTGAAAVTATCVLAGPASSALASGPVSDNGWGMLIDVTRCTGCDSCALACKQANNRPNATVVPAALSSDAYTFIDFRPNSASAEPVPVKRQCMHCQHPACVSACTVGALTKSADGPVVYDSKKCIGSKPCLHPANSDKSRQTLGWKRKPFLRQRPATLRTAPHFHSGPAPIWHRQKRPDAQYRIAYRRRWNLRCQ